MQQLISIFIGCFCLLGVALGQVTVAPASLDFGEVDELSPKTLKVGLTNASDQTVTLTFRNYTRFGRTAFTTDVPTLTLGAGVTDSISVSFAPMQNVEYNSEILILTDDYSGDLSLDVTGQGIFSIPYYDLTENSSEEDLKQNLGLLLSFGHVQLGYNPGRTEMFMVVDNQRVNGQGASQNTIECVYTGVQVVGYTSRNDAQNQGFNTEHTFPQSLFSSQEPMQSDLHHLFPVEANANSQRGNNPFGVVSNPSWQVGGSKSNGTTFEPRDAHKGDAARAMLYFYLRYGDYGNFFAPQENLLVNWHNTFAPDAVEKKRNEDIYAAQGNRNPLVDYPQLIERIHQFVGFSAAPTEHALDVSATSLAFDTIAWGPQNNNSAVRQLEVVNHGNILESFSNFRSNVAGISFDQPLGDTTLLPGEDLPVRVRLTPQDTLPINGYIAFNTSAPGMDSIVVPLSAFVRYIAPQFVSQPGTRTPPSLGPQIPDTLPGPVIFPNPTQETVYIYDANLEGYDADILIYNLAGQKLREYAQTFTDSRVSVPLVGLPESLYIVEVHSGDYRKFFRLWVKY